jgi:hypothetical protein
VALITALGPASDLLAGSLIVLAAVVVDAVLLGRSATAIAGAEFPDVFPCSRARAHG